MMRTLFEAASKKGGEDTPERSAPVTGSSSALQELGPRPVPVLSSSPTRPASAIPRGPSPSSEEDTLPLSKRPRTTRSSAVVPAAPPITRSGPAPINSILNCSGETALQYMRRQSLPADLAVLEKMNDRELLESWCQDEARAQAKKALLATRATRSMIQFDVIKENKELAAKNERIKTLAKDRGVELKKQRAKLAELEEELKGVKRARDKMIETARSEARDEALAEARSLADEALAKAKEEWKTEFLNSEECLRLVQVVRQKTQEAFLGSKELFTLLFPEAVTYYHLGLDEQAKWAQANPEVPFDRSLTLKNPPEPTSFSYVPELDHLHTAEAPEFAECVFSFLKSTELSGSQPDLTMTVVDPLTSTPSPTFAGLGELPGGASPGALNEGAVDQLAAELDAELGAVP